MRLNANPRKGRNAIQNRREIRVGVHFPPDLFRSTFLAAVYREV